MTTKENAIQRFWSFVNKTDSCWLWTGSLRKDGYGRIRPGYGLNYISAHRFSWVLHFGPVPDGQQVLHKCDVPLCVKPDDLFLGDQRANVDDMVRKGRQRKGAQIFLAKLDDDKVREIRSLFSAALSNEAIASRFDVTKNTIWRLRKGLGWKHVPILPPSLENFNKAK